MRTPNKRQNTGKPPRNNNKAPIKPKITFKAINIVRRFCFDEK